MPDIRFLCDVPGVAAAGHILTVTEDEARDWAFGNRAEIVTPERDLPRTRTRRRGGLPIETR